MSEIKVFTVYRDSWLRGTTAGVLLDEDGRRCCVGFYARQAYHSPDSRLRHVADMESLSDQYADGNRKVSMLNDDENFCQEEIYSTNDTRRINDDAREAQLTEAFANLGITVHFVDGKEPE